MPALPVVTRFAPSPTGFLHLGHAFAALFAARAAAEGGGQFLLRIEDIDQGRAKPEFERAIVEDLAWLGLSWPEPVRRQSEFMDDYRNVLLYLEAARVLYPCFCTRKDIQAEVEAMGLAPHGAGAQGAGPEGPVYPGTCRAMSQTERKMRLEKGEPYALRLDMVWAAARASTDVGALAWTDRERGTVIAEPEIFGDVVLARKDTPASYHLAATVDDHVQDVTLVTRGVDLFQATHVHRVLQALLNLETPDYHHHKLLTGPDGKRFAKRDGSVTIRALRDAGKSPAEVRALAGFPGPVVVPVKPGAVP